MGEDPTEALPEGVREGDVLVFMGGRLFVVDHLAPEALTIDLIELERRDSLPAE